MGFVDVSDEVLISPIRMKDVSAKARLANGKEKQEINHQCCSSLKVLCDYSQQLLAALRAIVDIDLNYYQKTTSFALDMYWKYLWEDNTDQAWKDILRSQSTPGLVTGYMIGQMEISRLRDIAERELGRDFDLKEFHYEVLRQGEIPLGYLEEHIRDYVACKKNPALEKCEEF